MQTFTPPPKTYYEPPESAPLSVVRAIPEQATLAVVTDGGVREADLVSAVTAGREVATVYDGVESNPSLETATAAADAVASADAVVAVGGGSVMDAAKAACARPAFGSVEAIRSTAADDPPPTPGVTTPLVCVPTTAGTGTETGHWAVLSDHEAGEKVSVGHPALKPAAAVLDPGLTASLPPSLTAMTGFDVITHAIEAFVSTEASPLTDPYAVAAFEAALDSLPAAVEGDARARDRMLTASYAAGLAMNNAGLGAVHAISHAVGGRHDTPHGLTNAVLLPAVVETNRRGSERARRRYNALTARTDVSGDRLAAHLDDLLDSAPLDRSTLPEVTDLDESLVARALDNVNMMTNPAALDEADVRWVCRVSFGDGGR
jgi:alcohol dehydrogenase class IV